MEPNMFKLDEYEYDMLDVFDRTRRYLHTVIEIDFEKHSDPNIHDIASRVVPGSGIFADGRYFTCKSLELFNGRPDGAFIRIVMLELLRVSEEVV